MADECELRGMPWSYAISRVSGSDCSNTRYKCSQCGKKVCGIHVTCTLRLCCKCVTLNGMWEIQENKEFYEKIYLTTTKPCRQ